MKILRKEERPVAIVALIVFAALNALLIANHWQSFTRGAHVGFWSVFYNHLNMSGYDIFSLIFISCMRLHWNALRHPLFVALLLPLFWINHQIMPPTEFNAAVLLMGALLVAADVWGAVLMHRLLRDVVEVNRMDAVLLTALFYGFAHVMIATMVPDHFALSLPLLLLTLPLAYLETEKSLPATFRGVRELFVQCWPLFLALFLYNVIDSVPKFAMEGSLSYDNQLYYNAMYFPAHSILMAAGFIYKPQLVRLARIWEDPEKHRRFDLVVLAMIGVIALITGAMALFMGWVGIPLMGLMYGLDFEQFRSLVFVMVATGGVCACIDFLYQIITVLRAQGEVTRLYLIAFVFAVPVAMLLVNFSGLSGAVVGSLVVMSILLLLLVTEYLAIRKRLE